MKDASKMIYEIRESNDLQRRKLSCATSLCTEVVFYEKIHETRFVNAFESKANHCIVTTVGAHAFREG